MNLKDIAAGIFRSTLKHVNPAEFLPETLKWNSGNRILQVNGASFQVPKGQNIYVIGTGKASPTMAAACENILGNDLAAGLIIAPPGSKNQTQKIVMLEGSHPLPDEKTDAASKKLMQFIGDIPHGSVVLNLLSGGTSSLFCLPAEGITIGELHDVYKLLLESGASIHEVNTVRKTLSQVKGGLLLHHLKQHTLFDLIISDVPGDDLRYIGSGPTTSQEISFSDAKKIAEKHGIWEKLPEPARTRITESIKADKSITTPDFGSHHAWIVSSAATVAGRTKELLENEGFNTTLVHPAWTGFIDDYEELISKKIEEDLAGNEGKSALVFYGECTVKVTGDGLGGRNQELALRMAKRLKKIRQNTAFLSAGTDGIDGPTEMAGAVVDQNTWPHSIEQGMAPESYIATNDSYHFFRKAGGHIKTGPTGNNVMDIQIVLTG